MNEEDLMRLVEESKCAHECDIRRLANQVIDHARQAERDRCCEIIFRLCDDGDAALRMANAIRNRP